MTSFYTYRTEYNGSCHCHPEYQELIVDRETLPALAEAISDELLRCGLPLNVDPSEIRLARELDDIERAEFESALATAQAPARERIRLEKEDRAKREQAAALRGKILGKRAQLLRLLTELTPEAAQARNDEIAALENELKEVLK